MPVRLARLGYRVGLAGKWHIHPKEAFPFERVPGFAVNCLTKDPSHTMEGVEEFISRDREEPFCLVVASVNPHVPWTGGDLRNSTSGNWFCRPISSIRRRRAKAMRPIWPKSTCSTGRWAT